MDGGPQIFFPLKGLPPGPTNTVYNQIFFTTPALPASPHSLVVVYQGSGQQTPLTLDFLYVTNTSTLVSQGASSNPNSTTTGTAGTSTPTADKGSSPDSTPVGAIVGGVIGGLALIALALLLLWWYKRTQRHAESRHDLGPSTIPPPLTVSPFTYGSSASRSRAPEMIYGTSTNPSFQNDLQPQRGVPVMAPYHPPSSSSGALESQSTLPTSRHAPSASTSSGAMSGYNSGAIAETREMRKPQERPLQPIRHRVLHQDSGLRLGGGRSVIDDVPPTYTPD